MIDERPLLVITARYGSSRLRGKVLRPFWQGLSLLEFLIKRLQTHETTSRIVLATVHNNENEIISEAGRRCGIKVVRGSEEDVLERVALAVAGEDAPFVGRITGDNPLTDPLLAMAQWEEMKKVGADYSYCKECPVGTAIDIWTRKAFLESEREAETDYQREHINAWIWDHPERYKILWYLPQEAWRRKDISVTVDTLEQMEDVKKRIRRISNPLNATINDIIV